MGVCCESVIICVPLQFIKFLLHKQVHRGRRQQRPLRRVVVMKYYNTTPHHPTDNPFSILLCLYLKISVLLPQSYQIQMLNVYTVASRRGVFMFFHHRDAVRSACTAHGLVNIHLVLSRARAEQ